MLFSGIHSPLCDLFVSHQKKQEKQVLKNKKWIEYSHLPEGREGSNLEMSDFCQKFMSRLTQNNRKNRL